MIICNDDATVMICNYDVTMVLCNDDVTMIMYYDDIATIILICSSIMWCIVIQILSSQGDVIELHFFAVQENSLTSMANPLPVNTLMSHIKITCDFSEI